MTAIIASNSQHSGRSMKTASLALIATRQFDWQADKQTQMRFDKINQKYFFFWENKFPKFYTATADVQFTFVGFVML